MAIGQNRKTNVTLRTDLRVFRPSNVTVVSNNRRNGYYVSIEQIELAASMFRRFSFVTRYENRRSLYIVR